jgi:hypothetical protein
MQINTRRLTLKKIRGDLRVLICVNLRENSIVSVQHLYQNRTILLSLFS